MECSQDYLSENTLYELATDLDGEGYLTYPDNRLVDGIPVTFYTTELDGENLVLWITITSDDLEMFVVRVLDESITVVYRDKETLILSGGTELANITAGRETITGQVFLPPLKPFEELRSQREERRRSQLKRKLGYRQKFEFHPDSISLELSRFIGDSCVLD